MNYKKIIVLILSIFILFILVLFMCKFNKNDTVSNNSIDKDTFEVEPYKEEIEQMHKEEQEKLMQEIKDDNTYNYFIKESSDSTITLEYAYITDKYTKIKFSYVLPQKNNMSSVDMENKLRKEYNTVLSNITSEEDTYIETPNGEKYVPQRTSDADGGRTHSSQTGIYEWHDTFPITTKEATELFTLYFTNANNEVVKLELEKEK